MRNIVVGRRPKNFILSVEAVNVKVDGCPGHAPTLQPCQTYHTSVVYNGSESSATDTGLVPFTG